MTTYIGISRDHSVSMRSLSQAALKDYNATIAALAQASAQDMVPVYVTTINCGGPGSYDEVTVSESRVPIQDIKPLVYYHTQGGGTPLVDSILTTISELTNKGADPEDRFIVMATTDGEENSSRASKATLRKEIQRLTALGNWTFVIRVPRSARRDALDLGFAPDNILEWETNSRGQEIAANVTTQALSSFVSSSERATTKFFANLQDVSVEEVKAQLIDISGQVNWLFVGRDEGGKQIRDFVESKTNKPLLKGSAFYALVKTEPKVQANKRIAIVEKKTGAVYEGAAARQMLGLPTYGTVRLAPDELGDFEVYIQSTSVNRKVDPNTKILLWDGVGIAYKEGKSAR